MKRSSLVVLLVLVTATLLVTALGTPASAQSYMGARGSFFMPNNSEDGLQEFDNGFGGGVFAGFRFTPNLALEAGGGYYQAKWEDPEDFITEKDTVSSFPLTLTAKGFLPLAAQARLYAGGGVGMYFAKAKVEGSWKEVGMEIAASDTSNDAAFGYHVVAGGEFMFAPRVGLEVQAMWFKAEPTFSFFEGTASSVSVKPDIGGVTLSLGIVFLL